MPVTNILIVDDHPLFSMGLASLIGSRPVYHVVGVAKNSAEALKILRSEKPHLVALDLDLGDENGMDLIPAIKAFGADIAILVLSMHDERYFSERVLSMGAQGYIMKDEVADKVLDAIKMVIAGKVYLSDSERKRIAEALNTGNIKDNQDKFASVQKLSNRQAQILTLIGKGLGTIEIANKLNLSTKTIDTHKENIKLKLHCASSYELRQLAVEWAILAR
ncbi:MAG: response regulator transcription factor [Treponema sp.]|jgi:DNA-binding NarL/FixJ family response regulator|nr:response regulator transcription factor [Treponema sp.]